MLDLLEKIEEHNKEIDKKEEFKIGFNFDEPKKEEVKTNLVSGIEKVNFKTEVNVLLFLVDNKKYNISEKTYNLKLCGKSMKSWLTDTLKDYHIKEIEVSGTENMFELIKQNKDNNYKYTLALTSETPLLTHKTVKDIMEYFVLKDLSVLKFNSGYMFKTDYLSEISSLYNPMEQNFSSQEFFICDDFNKFAVAQLIMQEKILKFHRNNGVEINDSTLVSIDADVSIESGAKIASNNKLFGKTIIEKGANLKSNNVIENAVVCENASIENSTIKSSVIGKNCVVENYCTVINNSMLKDNVKLQGYNYIDNKLIEGGKVLKAFEK